MCPGPGPFSETVPGRVSSSLQTSQLLPAERLLDQLWRTCSHLELWSVALNSTTWLPGVHLWQPGTSHAQETVPLFPSRSPAHSPMPKPSLDSSVSCQMAKVSLQPSKNTQPTLRATYCSALWANAGPKAEENPETPLLECPGPCQHASSNPWEQPAPWWIRCLLGEGAGEALETALPL